VVGLSDSRTVTREPCLAGLIGLENGPIDSRRLYLQPGKQGRTEIETDFLVIVQDPNDPLLSIEDAGRCVWRIAFSCDTLVPIMIGVSRILDFNRLKPRIFSRRLVKVTMNAYITHKNRSWRAP
jgi:hypothetical protein